MDHLAELKKKLDRNANQRHALTAERNAAIISARASGQTWRQIASTLGMTEQGTMLAAKKAAAEQSEEGRVTNE